jgi:predicted O-methyltransferase YrrM
MDIMILSDKIQGVNMAWQDIKDWLNDMDFMIKNPSTTKQIITNNEGKQVKWQDIEGWFDKENYKMIQGVKLPAKSLILEIGTYCGKSTTVFREIFPFAEIYTCDPVERKERLLPRNVHFYLSGWQKLAKTWDKKIDLLFIDSSHTYRDTKKCFNQFVPFVKNGGYVLFHDYHIEHTTVDGIKQFVNELGECKLFTKGEFGGAVWQKKD